MDRLDSHEKKQNKFIMNAAQTAAMMAILTLGSKFLGFIREMVMAGFFGAGEVTDAYVMSQSIPSMLFAGIFGAVATSYMPLLSDKIEKGSEKEGNEFTSQVINILLIASIISSVVGFIFSDELTAILASGFTGERARLTSFFLKITFSYVIFSSTTGILNAYLQYKNTFLPQIFIDYTQNIIVIATIVISAYSSYYYLAFGLLIAYALRLVLIFALSKKKGYKYYTHGEKTRGVIKDISRLAIPVFIGSTVTQINLFVDKYLASGLVVGSVSALNYASTLNTMIMSISVTVLATMIYPRLAQAQSMEAQDRFSNLVQTGFNLTIIVALPFSLGAMVYSDEIVQVIFERGAFDVAATSLTGSAYLFYSIGMTFMALNTLFTQVYYSMHNMKTPMVCAAVGVIINISLNLMLVGSMQHNGLALATSISAICNSGLLYVGIRKKDKNIQVIKDKRKIFVIVITSFVSVGLSLIVYKLLVNLIWMPRMIYLGLSVGVAIIAYLIILKKCKVEELDIIKDIIKK